MAHVLQGDDLCPDLILRQLLARDMPVLRMVWAVYASIDAVVGKIEGSEHDDPVAIELPLDLLCQMEYLLVPVLKRAHEQERSLPVAESLEELRLRNHRIDELSILLMALRPCDCLLDLSIIDEILRLH